MESAVDHIANGLFNVFKSIGKVPMVRVVQNEISERVYKKLTTLYTQNNEEGNGKTVGAKDRPLLIILDRNQDIHTMLYHAWKYLCLI